MSHDRSTHRLIANPQLGRDLFQRHALLVQPCGFSSPRLIQTATADRGTLLSSEPVHSRAVYSEPPYQLIDGHTLGVLLGQRSPIRDTQTGLKTRRILRHRATHILDSLTLRTRR